MVGRETVVLEMLDGDQFEKFCKRIFEKLGYGRVTNIPHVGDKGRDLIIDSLEGRVTVECKHQPLGSVGRPVIQKLHSAVISSNGSRGIVVTTGKFSKTAIDHAATLTPPIELIDMHRLVNMATKAGMALVYGGRKRVTWSYPVIDHTTLELRLGMFLDNLYESHPYRPSEINSLALSLVTLIPTYSVKYFLNAVFETSVGLVHHEIELDGRMLVRGDDGGQITPDIQKYMSRVPIVEFASLSIPDIPQNVGDYTLDSVTLAELATNHIISRHTRIVSYTGRNNITYTKTCTPRKKDVELVSAKQIYLPIYIGKTTLFSRSYPLQFLSCERGSPWFLEQSLDVCALCQVRVTKKKPYLCNSCGRVAHLKKLLSSHDFRCADCGRTLCRRCTRWVRHFLLFKRYVCEECANELMAKGKKPRKLKKL